MTYRELFYRDHADMEHEDAMALLTDSCPQRFYYAMVPEYCQHVNADCNGCWNREIPDELKPILMRDLDVEMAEVHEVVKEVFAGTVTSADVLPGGKFEHAATLQKIVYNPPDKNAKPAIKDSGDRTEFATGAVRDMREGKGRCDLMPLRVAGLVMQGDAILDYIGLFQDTSDVGFLYSAIKHFAHAFGGLASMLLEVSKHFEEGAKKYGENNWQKGIPVHCYIDSAVRHYLKWLRGDKDEPHDRAFVWNLMCCIWEVDYREKEEKDEAV